MGPPARPLFRPGRFRGAPVATVAGRAVPVADGPVLRTLGLALLDRDAAGPGLLLPRCRHVHTFGMRFDLDLLFCDRDLRVVAMLRRVPPGRFAGHPDAWAVLEVPAGGRD